MAKSRQTAEYGDFQTPEALARRVCALLSRQGLRPASLVEPTCGLGSLLFAGLDQFPGIDQALGADVNPSHIRHAEVIRTTRADGNKTRLNVADFFETDWAPVLASLPEPVLILGNLPWVTNSHLATIGSANVPTKSNFQNRKGLDAVTGKANFDVSEWMLARLIEGLQGRHGALAMLCKSAVARKALLHAWQHHFAISSATIHRIDAVADFGAAVDAALLTIVFGGKAAQPQAEVYGRLDSEESEAVIGCEDGILLADLLAYRKWKHLRGKEAMKWRSGVKHDCAKVMELVREGARYRNGLGELVELEDAFLFPLLKSSHLANGSLTNQNRWMLVPQTSIGEETAPIELAAPHTWKYLCDHATLLGKRASSIYRDRPAFSIFGVGDYTFAPWKVAISGFYKRLNFVAIGSPCGKPTVLDDTSYFLPCETQDQAEFLVEMLSCQAAQEFYRAFVFWDSKRPITAELLRRLDLRRLSECVGRNEIYDSLFTSLPREALLWPE
jgi:hypothetical protein